MNSVPRSSSPNSVIKSCTTCIVGGGNSAHVLIPFLSEAGHHVNIFTRRPDEWHDTVLCVINEEDASSHNNTHVGILNKKSSNPAYVIPDADVIVFCCPVAAQRPLLAKIGPHINKTKEVFVGTIYGQACFNMMVHEMEKECNLTNTVCFAIAQIPWICRTIEYGKIGACYGGKHTNLVALSPADRFDKLMSIWLEDISLRPLGIGKFHQADFLSISLAVDNQIIHPARCYGLWKNSQGSWPDEKSVPYFYKDFDEDSADYIRKLDEDYSTVRDALKKKFSDHKFKYMLNYMELEKLNHESSHVDILASFRDSKQLASIKTPTIAGGDGTRKLNTDCRFFTDDIPYGLLVVKWIAEQLQVKTPFLDEVIHWAQTVRDEAFLTENGIINRDYCLPSKYKCGIPESYGLVRLEDCLDAKINGDFK